MFILVLSSTSGQELSQEDIGYLKSLEKEFGHYSKIRHVHIFSAFHKSLKSFGQYVCKRL
uniref:Uncharacterized protein n=2 Tax=Poecilia TaxID=8080 RepID=A0A3B3UYM8_9TELE